MKSVAFWKVTTFILATITLVIHFFPIPKIGKNTPVDVAAIAVKPQSAKEIYPEFTCPCCGQPLNKENPCCGAMTQMIDFIDKKVENGLSEEEIILATVKEFGIERLTKKEKQEEVKRLLAAKAPADAPKIKFDQELQDLGEISQAKGEVSADFNFRNEGESDLLIEKLSTSCGCTLASIIYQGKEGPRFTMAGHGKTNPDNWQVSITAGDWAILRVYYDPSVHKDLKGPVTRTISVFSNDPVEFEKKVIITLNQIP